MYVPSKFRADDPEIVRSFIRENPFGLLLSVQDGEIHDTHTPFVISKDGKLLGHIARANPQWKIITQGEPVKVVFTGAHSYISPRYYETDFNVPTWNYNAVSVTGRLSLIEDTDEVLEFLDHLIAENEESDSPWTLDRDDERYMNLLKAIGVFSISMGQVDASFKLNQNKSAEDQRSVANALQSSGCPLDGAVACLISKNIKEAKQDAAGQSAITE